LVGALYMYLAIIVGVTAFSAAAVNAYGATMKPLEKMTVKVLEKVAGRSTDKKFLHEHINKVKYQKITEVVIQLMILNIFGMLANRAFVDRAALHHRDWSWMGSFYWAAQTTTTIGYGDMSVPFNMRWFLVFYIALGTFFVGNAFGKLGSIKQELADLRKHYVWQRREVSKRMIEEMQAYDHDDKIDQYEFVVASLLLLDKIDSSDIYPIMDKFRMLAGERGYIQLDETSGLECAPSSGMLPMEDYDDAVEDLNYAE
jgi:hypothetical protein